MRNTNPNLKPNIMHINILTQTTIASGHLPLVRGGVYSYMVSVYG